MGDDEAPRAVTDTTVETPPPATVPAATTETAERPTPSIGTAVPEARRAGSNRRWLIIAAIAVLVLLVIGYVIGGASATAGPVSRADAALTTTVSHNNTIADVFKNDPFKSVDFKSANPDLAAAKAALATVKKQFSTWQEDVTGDRNSLLKVRGDLNGSLLTLPEQATIDRHRHRVDAALSALGTAQKGIDLFNKQLAFLDPLIDALAGLEAFSKAADANDLAGMQSQLTAVGAAVQKSIDLSQGASLPPGLTTGLNNFQKMVNDLKGLVSAAQAHNVAAVDKYVAAVDADGKALEAIDENAIEQAETALVKPLSDAYDRDMKTAAGG